MKITKINNEGSSLIEVMIALFVLAIGMLGVLAMQTRAVQLNKNAYNYSQATVLAADIYEAMLTAPSSAGSYEIDFGVVPPPAPDCSSSDCTPDAIADWNQSQWLTNIANLLPGGEGQIEEDGDREYVISVRFITGYKEATDEPEYEKVVLDVRI